MTRKVTMLAVLATLIVGLMTAGVRAGDDGRDPSRGRDLAARTSDFGGRDIQAKGCTTFKCLNKKIKGIIKALNTLCVIPISQYGPLTNGPNEVGYMWDNTTGDGSQADFNTTALDVTEAGDVPGAFMIVEC